MGDLRLTIYNYTSYTEYEVRYSVLCAGYEVLCILHGVVCALISKILIKKTSYILHEYSVQSTTISGWRMENTKQPPYDAMGPGSPQSRKRAKDFDSGVLYEVPVSLTRSVLSIYTL